MRESSEQPVFLSESRGGHFKQRDPTVDCAVLERRWLGQVPTIYIGKATSLKARVRQFCDFGAGKPIGHWGGRFVWQIADSDDATLAWKTTATAVEARELEKQLLSEFRKEFGRWPFANLRG